MTYFSTAVLKHHEQGSLQEEGFVWLTVLRGEESVLTEWWHGVGVQAESIFLEP